jgi:N-acetylmuramoyl-L-alanine amidase
MTNDSRFTGSKTRNICLLALVLACAGQLAVVCWNAEKGHAGNIRPMVVIDPGHGGGDSGATGLSATTEKAVALKLATLLAEELKHAARVVITRSDDTEMEGADRVAVANRNRASVFVSLHAGASFSRQPSGYAVYHYLPYASSTLGRGEDAERPSGPPKAPVKWQAAQLAHQKESEHLARLIREQIQKSFPGAPCRLFGAPLLTLEGANSPAALIEFGFLTNPSDEKKMTSAKHQTAFVKAIGDGIRSFLKSPSNQQPAE